MPTKCQFYHQRVVNVDYFDEQYLTNINTKNIYHLVLLSHGAITLGIENRFYTISSPCIIAIRENSNVSLDSSHLIKGDIIQFDPYFLNVNISFEMINSGEYDKIRDIWGFAPLDMFKHKDLFAFPLSQSEYANIKKHFSDFRDAITHQKDNRWSCRARLNLNILLESIHQISMEFSNNDTPTFNISDKHIWVTILLKEIHALYTENIDISYLCSVIKINKTSAEKGLKEIVGFSINEYIINYRINCACNLLATTELLVSEIAHACGYNDCAYFNKQFKLKMNTTPNTYRKTVANKRKLHFSQVKSR